MRCGKILVVEDEPILALELEEDLQGLGYEVLDVVHDGDLVEGAVLRGQPDIILMDVKLCGFRDGIDVVRQLRNVCDTPVVFLTSYSKGDLAGRIEDISASTYLGKPYKTEELVGVIGSALAERG